MIYFTQFVYIKEGCEFLFDQFEKIALGVLPRYHGEVLLRVRPSQYELKAGTMETPSEIQVVRFETMADFENFKNDDERKKFLHLKAESVKSTLLLVGQLLDFLPK